mmetsp:Transcript_58594/g.154858  ORF Transcript_58594/g.154858 Transcript_58594/m.154858 type:complete len:299 (+) Transcript_58594:3966-4862(+)
MQRPPPVPELVMDHGFTFGRGWKWKRCRGKEVSPDNKLMPHRYLRRKFYLLVTRDITKGDVVRLCERSGPRYRPQAKVDGLLWDGELSIRWRNLSKPYFVYPYVPPTGCMEEWRDSDEVIFIKGSAGQMDCTRGDWRILQIEKFLGGLREFGARMMARPTSMRHRLSPREHIEGYRTLCRPSYYDHMLLAWSETSLRGVRVGKKKPSAFWPEGERGGCGPRRLAFTRRGPPPDSLPDYPDDDDDCSCSTTEDSGLQEVRARAPREEAPDDCDARGVAKGAAPVPRAVVLRGLHQVGGV